MTRIAGTGATGAMGTAVIETASEREDLSVELAVSRSPPEEAIAGHRIRSVELLKEALEADIEVLVDFTVPSSSVEYVETATAKGVASVVGTTGFAESDRERLRQAADRAPVLVAPNFSRGIQAMIAGLEAVLERLPGYDIEVTETHHRHKRDAPSGTANRLLGAIDAERGTPERVYGRSGEAPRLEGSVGVHARRAGSVTGEHEVLLAAADEELRLVHRAQSKAVFASGALDAAVWLADRSPGWYRFADVLEGR